MAAYVIAEVQVTDAERYEDYRKLVPASVEWYGGRFLVRGGRAELLEGDRDPQRMVILEFESFERAKAWWASEEYREARDLRQRTALSRLILVEGVEAAAPEPS